MTAADHLRRVRDLFELALEQPPDMVDAWLAGQTVESEQVRADVRSLLDYHTRTGSFLVEPIGNRMSGLMGEARVLHPGESVGPYSIVRELGRGGMGRVYLAVDGRLGRKVALKAVSPEMTLDGSHRERLRREARAAAALTHPGICTVYALEELEDDLFIASEFVDGTTLGEQIHRGLRPSTSELLDVARDLADALAHAHRHGVIHRDLKPDNVMMTGNRRVKILDFGLARLSTPDTAPATLTQPGTVFGTPAYMAPEQFAGRPADARTDVFAYGVLLYEYACGSHPFSTAGPADIPGRIVYSNPTPIVERRPDVPPSLEAVIDRCLSKTPDDRFDSGAEIAGALGAGDVAQPASPLTAWWRAHQFVAIGLYFIACILCWQIKEWQPGIAGAIFVLVSVVSTIAGVFRGHLLFTERLNHPRLQAEHRRAAMITLAADSVIAVALAGAGILLSSTRPVPAVLTIALGVGIALARLVLEPGTSQSVVGSR
jgi:hypothetical protein